MKKGIFVLVAVVMLFAGAMSASAQFRLDVNLNWPVVGGIALDPSIFGVSGSQSIDLSSYHLLLPDVRAYYQFGDGMLKGGVGVRLYTVIIESLLFPEAFLEVDLKPIVINATLGGYLFGVFGLANNLGTANLLLPDLSVYWAFNEWFRLGAGALFFVPLQSTSSFGYIVYVGARFVIVFK